MNNVKSTCNSFYEKAWEAVRPKDGLDTSLLVGSAALGALTGWTNFGWMAVGYFSKKAIDSFYLAHQAAPPKKVLAKPKRALGGKTNVSITSGFAPSKIPNRGNTCFAASLVQFCANTPILNIAVKESTHKKLFENYDQGRTFRIDEIRSLLGDNRVKVQQDPSEALIGLFSQDEVAALLQCNQTTTRYYEGLLMPRSKTRRDIPFLQLTLPNQQKPIALGELIRRYCVAKGSSDEYQDIDGQRYCLLSAHNYFKEPPPLLLVHLVRHRSKIVGTTEEKRKGKKVKVPVARLLRVDTPVTSPLNLSLPEEAILKGKGANAYHLWSVVCHHGSSLYSGHYTAYVKRSDKRWKCDDGTITQIEGGEFAQAMTSSKEAYLLAYIRKN